MISLKWTLYNYLLYGDTDQIFFSISKIYIQYCYSVGNNIRKFQVTTMKLCPFEFDLDSDAKLSRTLILLYQPVINNVISYVILGYTLSGYTGKVVASHAAVARSIPATVALIILCARRSGGTAHVGGGCDQSIGSTVYDAIVRSSFWLTATRSSQVSCFSTVLYVIDNWPHILW